MASATSPRTNAKGQWHLSGPLLNPLFWHVTYIAPA
jgi:hypothetical protein